MSDLLAHLRICIQDLDAIKVKYSRRLRGFGFRVWGQGFRAEGLGFRVWARRALGIGGSIGCLFEAGDQKHPKMHY